MTRSPTSTSFITPVSAAGVVQSPSGVEFGRGSFTLAAATTYFFPVGGQDGGLVSAHLHWDAAIIITSLTVEDCDFPNSEISDFHAGTGGEWIDEDPSTAFVGTKGAGVTVTNGVVAVTGGALGGCRFNVADQGARRTRIKVVVGATGGEIRCAAWAKE